MVRLKCYLKILVLLVLIHCGISIGASNKTEIKIIQCYTTYHDLGTNKPNLIVRCPANCHEEYFRIDGTKFYDLASNICVAGIHDGVIPNSGGLMVIEIISGFKTLKGTTQNGIKSNGGSQIGSFFTLRELPNTTELARTTTTPSTTTTTQTTTTTTQATTLNVDSLEMELSHTTTNAQVKSLKPKSTSQSTSTTKHNAVYNGVDADSVIARSEDMLTKTSSKTQTTTTKFQQNNVKDDENMDYGPNEIQNYFPTLAVSISCGAGLVLFLTALLLFCKCRNFNRRSSYCKHHNRATGGGVEACVCYVAVDSSVQGLLNDPETCERQCSLREKIEIEEVDEKTGCDGHAGPQCGDCSAEKCSALYDF